jgi:hypothetical protein
MPFAVDDEAMKGAPGKNPIISMDPAKPPVRQIPHMEWPRVIYLHPKEAFKVVVHRNTRHEIVEEEHIPSEHLSKLVHNPKELADAIKDGWVKEPYIAPPLPDPNANLYGPR